MTFVRALSFRRAVVAIAAFVVGAVGQAKADFVLDDFSQPTTGTFYQITAQNGNPFNLTTNLGTPPTLGVSVTRSATVSVTTGLSPNAASGTIGAGSFEVSTAANSTAVATLAYSFSAPADFTTTGVNALSVNFSNSDLGVPYSFRITDGTNTATISGLATAGPGTYTTSLSAFSGVNLAAVTGFEVLLNQDPSGALASKSSADFIIGNVSVVQEVPPPPTNDVPAPPAVFLALAALPVLGLRRKLTKKA
ncbi:hypothetical protein [Limnoglobus roseus]|uniref:PEP-CTERM sorting domain-containing protein n=1 Tax=Limnoglobus roseus TaxID=2598579 RepID=A0A5C1A528_9BACT|nr:hypothetical protein [Limnoglobus roseus]QEL14219.1 hypothetical protein PX52LOC_01089 [Limnoglobus roseus]